MLDPLTQCLKPVIQSTCPVPECPHTAGLWSPPVLGGMPRGPPLPIPEPSAVCFPLCRVGLSLNTLLPRQELPPCCTVLGLLRLVRGQDLGQGTWPRAAFLVSGVLVTQSKCLSLDTRAALCRALGCEPRVPTGLQALLSGHRARPGSPSVHRKCRGSSRHTLHPLENYWQC